MRLLSTTSLLQHYSNEFLLGDQHGLCFSGMFGALEDEPSPQTASKPPMTHRQTFRWHTPSITTAQGAPVALLAPHTLICANRDASNASGASGASSGLSNGTLYGVSGMQRGSGSGVVHDHGDLTGHGFAGHCWRAEFSSVQDCSRDPDLWHCWLVGSNGVYGTPSAIVSEFKPCHDTSKSSHELFTVIRQNLAYPTVTPSQPATPAGGATDSTITSPSPPWTVSADNFNLTDAEKELLRWHYCLGYLLFRRIQSWCGAALW
jgi:hypothetical protein